MKVNSIRFEEKQKEFKQLVFKEADIKQKIKEICYSEYDDLLSKLLILEEKAFLQEFEQNIKSQIEIQFTDIALSYNSVTYFLEQYRNYIYKNYYLNDFKVTSKAWSEYQVNLQAISNLNPRLTKKNTECFSYLTNYFYHCSNSSKIATHSCGEKLLEVYDENTNYNEEDSCSSNNRKSSKSLSSNQPNLAFVICIGCKAVYTKDSILLFCNSCKLDYYSRYLTPFEQKEELLPASWDKYHCNTILKDPMKCVKCQELFYYNSKSNMLKCKQCKFEIKPLDISWMCIICKQEFKCGAKAYCEVEFKIVRMATKNTLTQKITCLPQSVPCCSLNIEKTEFIHKKECNGILYKGTLSNQSIVVCEKCKAMNYYDKFIWTCPVCFKKFRQKQKETGSNEAEEKVSKFSKMSSAAPLNNLGLKKELNNKNNNLISQSSNLEIQESHTSNTTNIKNSNSNTSSSNNNNNININSNSNTTTTTINTNNTNNTNNSSSSKNNNNSSSSKSSTSTSTTNSNHTPGKTNITNITNEVEASEVNNDSKKGIHNKKNSNVKFEERIELSTKRSNGSQSQIEQTVDDKQDSVDGNHHDSISQEEDNQKKSRNQKKTKNLIDILEERNLEKKSKKKSSFNFDSKANSDNLNLNKELKLYMTAGNPNSARGGQSDNILKNIEIHDDENKVDSSSETIKKVKIAKNISVNKPKEKSEESKKKFNEAKKKSLSNDYASEENKVMGSCKAVENKDKVKEVLDESKSSSSNTTKEILDESKESSLNTNSNTNTNNNTNNNDKIILKNESSTKVVIETKKANIIESPVKEKDKEVKEIKLATTKDNTNKEEEQSKNTKEKIENTKEQKEQTKGRPKIQVKAKEPRSTKNSNVEKIKFEKDDLEKKTNDKIEENKINKPEPVVSSPEKSKKPSDNKNTEIDNSDSGKKSNKSVEPIKMEYAPMDLNEYKIIQQIGEGTYGKIYKVSNKIGNKFAMKKIICHNKRDLEFTKNEFELVMKYPHENIVKIEGMAERELDETTFALYILLELADSDWENEVSKRAKTAKYYKESELISILKQLVKCLVFLQSKKISHRDIKPQNILIFGDKYKIADFGEAKQQKQSSKQLNLNTLRGTELYMSPLLFDKLREDCVNKNSTTPQAVKHNIFKSDVFSLGYCMIYSATLTFDSIASMREEYEKSNIEKILRTWVKKRYSDEFITLVLKMIELQESIRFDFFELDKYLEKFN